ncbi:MAG: hypothetical protein RL043_1490, partial [Pseudomonadota bacterium]
MAKEKAVFVCSACGQAHAKWQGQCDGCGSWNSLSQGKAVAVSTGRKSSGGFSGQAAAVQSLASVTVEEQPRWSMGLDEFDRVLGGGLVPGGVVLLGGDPGIGKSTLLLQALAQQVRLSPQSSVIYVTGEESVSQVALRAQRLGLDAVALDRIQILAETQLESILATLSVARPRLVVIDSIQTMFSEEIGSAPGSVSQVRETAAALTRWAKSNGVGLFLVGHVTKEGALAGPRVLEHMVD